MYTFVEKLLIEREAVHATMSTRKSSTKSEHFWSTFENGVKDHESSEAYGVGTGNTGSDRTDRRSQKQWTRDATCSKTFS